MNRLAAAASALLALALALVLCLWAVAAVAVLTAARFVATAIGALGDSVRDLVRSRQ